MTTLTRLPLLAVAASLVLCAAEAQTKTPSLPPLVPACIRSWPEARYRGLGYDHIVHIRDDCSTDALCAVSTNVNPLPILTTVRAGTEVDVVTWVGSPAREFTPIVRCGPAL
jgi:hypothetical protein